MKILHNKILIFVVILTVVFSTLVVPSFAFDDNTVGEFVFKEEISFEEGYPSIGDFYFNCNGVLYWEIEVTSEPGTSGTAPMIVYRDNADNNEVIVYINGNWVDDSYRYLYFVGGGMEQNGNFYDFMNNNEYIAPTETGWYWQLYNVISSAIFQNGGEVPTEAGLSISLLCVVLALVAILLPVLLTFGIFIWVIKRI